MKLRNIDIIKANKAIEALIALKLPLNVKTNYKLAKLSLAIRSESETLELTRDQIAAKHANGKDALVPNTPEFAAFFKEWKELADMEVELNWEKIKLDELDVSGASISIEILRDLNPLIEQ